MTTLVGAPLARVTAVDVQLLHGRPPAEPAVSWALRGSSGHARYVERPEREQLVTVQPGLGRSEASQAALIPIRKNEAWWELSQDERRTIFELQSQHIRASLKYLPAIARRLYQSRELGEPFDFLTWFEFAPANAGLFDELLAMLRVTPEWGYVDREVEIRLSRARDI